MAADFGERVDDLSEHAPGTRDERLDSIKDRAARVAVVPAEHLTRAIGAKDGRDSGRKVDEIQGVGGGSRNRAGVDPVLERLLDLRIGDISAPGGRSTGLRAGDRDRPDTGSVTDRLAWNAVLGHEIHERAGEDEVKEVVELTDERRLCRLLPVCSPEDGVDLDVREESSVVVRDVRCGSGSRDAGTLLGLEHRDDQTRCWCHLLYLAVLEQRPLSWSSYSKRASATASPRRLPAHRATRHSGRSRRPVIRELRFVGQSQPVICE